MTKKTSIYCLTALLLLAGCSGARQPAATPQETVPSTPDAGVTEDPAPHAEVIAFILTRCPHAAEAMRSLLALKREMGSALRLSVGYIGLVDSEGNIDPSVGAPEIASSRMQVCVGITADDVSWLEYLECVYEGERWRSLPDGFETCVTRAEIDRDQVLDCIESGEGDRILTQAYAAAAGSRIDASPTLLVDGHFYGGSRKMADIKQYICYVAGNEETRPAACDGVAPPPAIAATMLFDERCTDRNLCDANAEVSILQKLIPGLTMNSVPFSSDAGRKMYDAMLKSDLGVKELPVVIIENELEGQSWIKDLFGEYMLRFGKGHLLALGRGWDPLAEICDNGVDDNGNGNVDCQEASCADTLTCREEKKGQLDLFIMSGCPFATQMLPEVDKLLVHFDKDRKSLDLRLQFIGEIEDDTLTSMHGPDEVAENLRMVCAQDLYGRNYRFMEYVLCRAEETGSPAWEDCVPKWMSKKKLARCADGDAGKALLRASYELADRIGITGSPTLLVNNKNVLSGRDLAAMVQGYCASNESPHCETPVAEDTDDSPTETEPVCR